MNTRTSLAAMSVALLVAGVAAAFSTGPDHDLSWHTVDGGGGASSGGAFAVHGTIGQPDAGTTMAGGTYAIAGGFWAIAGPSPACQGDVDGNDVVDFADLLAVLADWGDCPGCPADLDQNGVVDFQDVLLVLGNYGPCE